MNSEPRYWRAVLALVLVMAAGLAQAKPLLLTDLPTGSLGALADVLVEDGRPLSLSEAQTHQHEGLFRPGKQPVLNFGIGSRPVWVHLELLNPTTQALPFRLITGTTWFDRLDVFIIHDGQISARWQTGDDRPAAVGLIPAMGFAFTPNFPPGRSDLYLRADVIDPLVLPIELMPEAPAASNERLVRYGYGLLYGFLLALLAYNSMLYIGLRERSYLYYSLYLASFILLNLAYTGHGYAWLWPGQPLLQRYVILMLMVLYGCCGLLFASRFLALAEHAPRVLRVVRLGALLAFSAIALCIMMNSQLGAARVAFNFAALFTLGMVLLGIITIRHGHVAGRYFLAATIFGMLGAATTNFAVWGWLPFNSLTYHGLEYGITIEATLLALALAHRFNEMTAALSNITQSRDVLSKEVAERKQAENMLQEALDRLQKIASRVPGVVYQFRMRPDGSFCFPFASEASREVLRVSPEDLREDASRAFACVHPDDLDDLLASIQASARDLTPWNHECRVRFDDGTVRWLFGNSVPQREAEGSVLWHGFITDITERKQTEQAMAQARKAAEAALERAKLAENKIVNISEETRERIGQELHDNLGQHLTGVAFLSEVLNAKLKKLDWPEMQLVSKITSLINDAVLKTRHLAQGLYPVELKAIGLHAMLGQLASQIVSIYKIDCDLQYDENFRVENDNVAINLFRIAQEAVGNAIKHGGATRITIKTVWAEDSRFIEIRDNGCGISDQDELGGMGMHTMKYRASLIGATLGFGVSPNGGTSVFVRFAF